MKNGMYRVTKVSTETGLSTASTVSIEAVRRMGMGEDMIDIIQGPAFKKLTIEYELYECTIEKVSEYSAPAMSRVS